MTGRRILLCARMCIYSPHIQANCEALFKIAFTCLVLFLQFKFYVLHFYYSCFTIHTYSYKYYDKVPLFYANLEVIHFNCDTPFNDSFINIIFFNPNGEKVFFYKQGYATVIMLFNGNQVNGI